MTTLDEARDLLYGLPLESFVAERDVLTKAIRARGDRELANLVKGLRKPSAVAALVNQIVRNDPAGVDLILQAAALLRSAQAGALAGSGINASELQQQYRAAVGALAQSAPSRPAEVRAALEAATIDEASNDDLRTGCLVAVPVPISLFEAAEEVTSDTQPAPVDELEERRARKAAEKERAETAAKAAAEEAAEAERARKAAEKERKKQRTALRKQHRDAVRSHLIALDANDAASKALDEAGQQLLDTDSALAAAEAELEILRTQRDEIARQHGELEQTRSAAEQRTRDAQHAVETLAKRLAELEDALSD